MSARRPELTTTSTTARRPWWATAVTYQVYPRSFADSTGDGIGDLRGITSRLDHLVDLGVDAVWLSPIYVSPMADAGYDVADYRDVDPLFGTLADADALIAAAHERGLRLLMDLVPNHTSSAHRWFVSALAGAPGSEERARYLFRDGRGAGGSEPPNNWRSVFGGPAWTRVTEPDGRPGQWYLHLFAPEQPDLDWSDPQVRAEMGSVVRFWLDRGVDGFRVDVAHGLVKADGLPDWHADAPAASAAPDADGARPPMWDQDGVHEIYREWRSVVDGYDGDRVLIGETWAEQDRLSRYVRPDELHQTFAFALLQAPWDAAALRRGISDSIATAHEVGAAPTWVLSNHDVVRHPTRLALSGVADLLSGVLPTDPQPDPALADRRGRAASLMMIALPGAAYLYQGEELGLPEHTTMPASARQDPSFFREEGRIAGRDGARVPLPWSADEPGAGFGPGGATWLPPPDGWERHAADVQARDPGSTLRLYRAALALRRRLDLGGGALTWAEGFGDDVVAFSVSTPDSSVLVLATTGEPVRLPDGGEVALSSTEIMGGLLPADSCVWIVREPTS